MLRVHALALARRGLHVFPCKPRTKEPAIAGGCNAATVDPELIEYWWGRDPASNIGLATGPNSHVFALDVDGDNGEAELRKLEAQCGALPSTVEAITGSGRHLYFEWPGQPIRNSVGKVGAGLDIRGAGGYCLVPPSVHPSGRAYCWSVDSAKAFARAPEWLVAKAIGSNGNGAATPPSEWRDLVGNGVAEGMRNDSLARLAGYLLRHRVDAVVTLEMLTAWNAARCRPPLKEAEIAGIVDSIAARELKRRGAS